MPLRAVITGSATTLGLGTLLIVAEHKKSGYHKPLF
jgi:hypothetical protein